MVDSHLIRLNMSLVDPLLAHPKICLIRLSLKMMILVMTTTTIFRSKCLIKSRLKRLLRLPKRKRKLNNKQQKQQRKKLLLKLSKITGRASGMRTVTMMIIGMT